MAPRLTWVLLSAVVVCQRATDAITKTTQIVVPPDSNYIHLDLKGEEYIIPLRGHSPPFPYKPLPTVFHPKTSHELRKFYAKIAKINARNEYLAGKKFEWYGLLQPHYPPHLNEDEIPSEHVKPVVEHIEDDLKYDFRTKTHYI